MSRPLISAAVVLVIWACGVVPSVAGSEEATTWIVLHDGQRIETQDGFRVEGRRVVFTDALGALRSIPLPEVDLEASRRSADQQRSPAAVPKAEPKPPDHPVLVLEDKDLPTADEAEYQRSLAEAERRRLAIDREAQRARAARGDAGARPTRPRATAAADATTTDLAVVRHWSSAPSRQTGGLMIVGSVANPSEHNLDRVGVQIQLRDKKGKLVHTGRAFVHHTRLQPGAASGFRYVNPSLESLGDLQVEFRVSARALSWGGRPRVTPDAIPTLELDTDG